jgi:hypothetical protein
VLIKIGINALRVCVLLALILGILIWLNVLGDNVIPFHMLIGLLAMVALWLVGFGSILAPKGGSLGLGIAAIVVGILLPIVGLGQNSFLYFTTPSHWLIQVIHLLIGLAAIGVGEATAGRYKRSTKRA